MSDTKKFKLSKAITTHNGTVNELDLAPPTAKSFVLHGTPYDISKDGTVKLNIPAILGFVSDMTGHDHLVLQSIAACDVMPLADMVVGMVAVRPPNG